MQEIQGICKSVQSLEIISDTVEISEITKILEFGKLQKL